MSHVTSGLIRTRATEGLPQLHVLRWIKDLGQTTLTNVPNRLFVIHTHPDVASMRYAKSGKRAITAGLPI